MRALIIIVITLALSSVPGLAHQPSDVLLRQVRVEQIGLRTRVTLRLPATLLFAPFAAERAHASAPVDAPMLARVWTGAGWNYRIAPPPSEHDPAVVSGLFDRVARLTLRGRSLRLVDLTWHTRDLRPGDAAQHLDATDLSDTHIADVVVEAVFERRGFGEVHVNFADADLGLPAFVHLETQIDDLRTGKTMWWVGAKEAPIVLPRQRP